VCPAHSCTHRHTERAEVGWVEKASREARWNAVPWMEKGRFARFCLPASMGTTSIF